MAAKKKIPSVSSNSANLGAASAAQPSLLGDVRDLILSARQVVAQSANAALTMLYWKVGTRIRQEILLEKRGPYGEKIVATLSAQLLTEFGSGFTDRNLFRMIQFAEVFPDGEIVATLSRQLGWSHFRELIPLTKDHQRDFYAEMCRIERWSVRTLRLKVDSMLFERTALSRKPNQLIRQEIDQLREQDRLTPDMVFHDPYLLSFLGLKDAYAEKDLEAAILREMESFILELGVGFAFLARQKRMIIDGEDHYLDLLFYHRHLRRLVAIDLKLGAFKASDKGQMELYLAWLDRHERSKEEEKPIGLILCAGTKSETVELLNTEKDGIHVASYWTEVLSKDLLQKKLHDAVARARAQIGERSTVP